MRSSTLRVAGAGPMPISVGSTPTAAQLTRRPIGLQAVAHPTASRGRQNQRGAAVDDPAGVARGHRAVLLECRRQLREHLQCRLRPRMIVCVDDLHAFSRLDLDRHDLVGEPPRTSGAIGELLAAEREAVLLLAA